MTDIGGPWVLIYVAVAFLCSRRAIRLQLWEEMQRHGGKIVDSHLVKKRAPGWKERGASQ